MPEIPERIGPYRVISKVGEGGMGVLSRAIDNGFFCHSAMLRDPWLDSLRAQTEFTSLMSKVHQLQREASAAFVAGGGP